MGERRKGARYQIPRLIYASTPDCPQLVVTDANEQGLGLKAHIDIPLRARTNVQLEVKQADRRILSTARVVWSDDRGRAGIEFLDLSAKSRAELQKWLALDSILPAVGASFTAPTGETPASRADALLGSLADRALSITNAHGAAIAISNGSSMRCRASSGETAPPINSQIDPGSGFTGACLCAQRLLRCDNADSDPLVDRESCRALGISSIIAAPIFREGVAAGVIEVFSRNSNAFDESDCYALDLLAQTIACSLPAAGFGIALADAASNGTARAGQIPGIRPTSPGSQFPLAGKFVSRKQSILLSVSAILLAVCTWLSLAVPFRRPKNTTPSRSSAFTAAQSTLPTSVQSSVAAISTVPNTTYSLEQTRNSAKRGDPEVELQLGAAYASGQGVAEDPRQAVIWLTRSAGHGNVTAAATLGAFYWAGRGVNQGYLDAYMWSAIASAEGDEASTYRLAILHSRLSPAELGEAKRRAADWLRVHHNPVTPKHE